VSGRNKIDARESLSQGLDVAAAIRDLRTELRFTQVQFAAELGITPTSVYRYEAGSSTPTNEILAKILQYAVSRQLLHAVQNFADAFSKRTGLGVFEGEDLGPESPLIGAIGRLRLEQRMLVMALVKMLGEGSDTSGDRIIRILLEPWIEKAKQEFGSPDLAFSTDKPALQQKAQNKVEPQPGRSQRNKKEK